MGQIFQNILEKNRVSKLQKVLNDIMSGKRKEIYDLSFTLDEYLFKIDDMSFIEHLLKLDVFIPFSEIKKFENSVEIGCIFCKYNKYLYNFNYSEEDLFSYVNGKLFINILVENNHLTYDMIGLIKNHIEIVDILGKEYSYKFSSLSKEIKEKLITVGDDGKYPIEKYFKDDSIDIRDLIVQYDNPKVLIEVCKKYNKYNLLIYLNENALMYKINDNYTLLDDLLEKKIIPHKLSIIPKNKTFINYLLEKKLYKYLSSADEKVLLLEIENGKTLLEDLLEKRIITKIDKPLISEKTLNLLNRINRLDVVTKVSADILVKPVQEVFDIKFVFSKQTVLEYLLDKGCRVIYFSSFGTKEEEIIKILYNRGEFELLFKSLDSKKLFYEVEEGIPLIDKLLEKNLDINFGFDGVDSIILAQKLYKYNRVDLLVKGNLNILLNFANNDETYLDYIVESVKEKKYKINLSEIKTYNCTVNELARFYLTIARHDMMEYIDKVNENKLLREYDGKTLLDELLDLDSDLTLSKVISSDQKSNMKIAIILRSRGLDQKDVDIPLENKKFIQDYLNKEQRSLGIGPLPMEGEYLLEKLKNLFLNDEQSDPLLVEALISGYRYSLLLDYKNNIKELRNLVELKEQNEEDFVYLEEEDGAFFRPVWGSVHCDNTVINTILHETGHALHSYLVDNKMPKIYERVVQRVRENPETLKKVEWFANKFSQVRDEVKELAKKKYENFFEHYFTEEKIKEIEKFLQKTKLEKKDEFRELGLSDDVMDIILDNIFTSEEYIDQQKRILIQEYADVFCRTEYGSLMAICDILDAVYEGELNSGVLKNRNGEKIKRTPGHGISYYCNAPDMCFCEMVANFAAISKSRNSIEMLELLKSLVGDELYNMLSDFYYGYISNADQATPEESMHL